MEMIHSSIRIQAFEPEAGYSITRSRSLHSSGWLRQGDRLEVIDPIDDWISPRLRIRFHLAEPEPQLFRPNGEPFTTLDQERQRAEQERQRAEQAEQRAARLAERLRAAGIDPDTLE